MSLSANLKELLKQGEDLLLQQRPQEASVLAESILFKSPDNPRALHLGGLAASVAGDFERAVGLLSRAIELMPLKAEWFADLATLYFSTGCIEEAEECGRHTLVLDPDNEIVHDLMAIIASHRGRNHCALDHLKKLAALRPTDEKRRARVAIGKYAVGDYLEAMRLMRSLIDEGKADRSLHSEYVSALLYDCHQNRASLRRGFEEWATRWCATREHRPITPDRLCAGRKLRIAYLSGEFGTTPSRHFLLPIFRNHDRERFEISIYSSRRREDACSDSFRTMVDRWVQCAGMEDEDLADLIRCDGIDILVDLSGHFREHRLPVFALNPAPVQVAYPLHPATTGISSIRYIFADKWVCPDGCESQYTEQVIRLSSGFLMYDPPAESPPLSALPSDQSGHVIFGLFQWPAKQNAFVWDAVARVLHDCPNALLLVHHSSLELDEPSSPARERVALELSRREINPKRALFRGPLPLEGHLELLGTVDIALDTFPFNGTTTTCECLWMGVPVITLTGQTHAGRVGYELLDRIGMSDLAAPNLQEYVAAAVRLAGDRDRLRALRLGLRDRLLASTLLESAPLVQEMEAAYIRLWSEFVEENRWTRN